MLLYAVPRLSHQPKHMQNEHGMQVESSQLTCDDAAWQRR